MPVDRALKRQRVERLIRISAAGRKLWGRTDLGMAMTARYFSDDQWVSISQLAAVLDASDDTLRRALGNLVSVGRVEKRREGREWLYRASKAVAEKTYELIAEIR